MQNSVQSIHLWANLYLSIFSMPYFICVNCAILYMCELCFYPRTVVKNKPPRKASECSRSFWILDTTRLTRQKRRRRRKGRYLIFSQNLFLAAVHNGMQWNHLLHSSAQLDFGHVFSSPIYGTLKNVSLQLFFFPLHFLGIGRRYRERGVVSVATAALCSCWEQSTIVAAVCTLALSWRPQNSVFGRCWHRTSKTFRRQ